MFAVSAQFRARGVSRALHGTGQIQRREFLGVRERAHAQAAGVYFSAASFEEAMLATSVLGFSFCSCS